MRVLTIIPARIGSSRLPEKPLRHIQGEPLIRWATRRALSFGIAGEVVVATDDQRVLRAVMPFGVRGVMTNSGHRSGTERIAEVLTMPDFTTVDIVLNLQCDQPFLPREAASGALQQVRSGFPTGTSAVPLETGDLTRTNVVKVSVDSGGRATSFFRTEPITRNRASRRPLHHLGVYAYSRRAVLDWVQLPDCVEEHAEQLEQLRPLQAGIPMGVALLDCDSPLAIDTEDDLRRAQYCGSVTRDQTRKSA